MTPRRRSSRKAGWPANLYERDGYYSYRNPLDGVEYGLGRNKKAAFDQSIEANLRLHGAAIQPRLIHRITGDGKRTVGKWNEKYRALLIERGKLADVTLRTYKTLGGRMVRMLKPDTPLSLITPLEVTRVLDETAVIEGKARTAQALRNFMRDSFREARVQGWYVGENPVIDTKLSTRVEIQRARLSFDHFMKIYQRPGILPWLRNAMALGLVSGQRREDLARAQFHDFHDEGWYLIQQSEKSVDPHKIVIPYELRLKVFGLSLGEVVSQCRRTGVLSKHLVHQTVNRGNSPAGRAIWVDTISHRFAEEIDRLKVNWSPKTPPTFHEIRSLSERLYSAQGGVNTQELLGHNQPETTEEYHDPRGSEWVRIKVTV